MAGNSKYKPGQTRRIALSRIRVSPADCPDNIPSEALRAFIYNCGKKYNKKAEWYRDIPAIMVRYVPKHKHRQFVLVEGGEHYLTAQKLGVDTILCTFVDDEPVCDLSLWF